MATISLSADYLKVLRQHGLLDEEQATEAMEAFRKHTGDDHIRGADAAYLGRFLVGHDYLTEWQHRQVFEGHPEKIFLGKYKLIRPLGAGGMSMVFLAEDRRLKRRVAIKVLPNRFLNHKSYFGRFLLEARAVAQLDHPNIVQAYNVDNDGKTHYIVMQYVEGIDLYWKVQQEGGLPFREAAEYIRQAAAGLAHAHERGMIHRDIKPANLLVDKEGTVKILDMGLARLRENKERSLTLEYGENVIGTADYLAPEQAIDSHNADERADIYSLGCTLYYLLTGRVPFPDGTITERLIAHQHEEPDPIVELREDVPPALVALCEKMMAKDRDDRIQTAEEVSRLFAAWLHGQDEVEEAEDAPAKPAPRRRQRGSWMGESVSSLFGSGISALGSGVGMLPSRMTARRTPAKSQFLIYAGGVAVFLAAAGLILWAASGPGSDDPADDLQAAKQMESTTGTVVVEWPLSERNGARLNVDGHPVTVGPERDIALKLPPGDRTFVLQRSGFEPYQRVVTVEAGTRFTLLPLWTRVKQLPDLPSPAEPQDPGPMPPLTQPVPVTQGTVPLDQLQQPVTPPQAIRLSGARSPLVAAWGDSRLAHASPVRCVAYHPRRPLLATACQNGELTIWHLATRRQQAHHPGEAGWQPQSLNYSPGGGWLVSREVRENPAGSRIRIYDGRTGERLKEMATTAEPHFTCLTFRPGEEVTMLTGSSDGTIGFWNPSGVRQLHTIRTPLRPVQAVAASPEGRFVAAVGKPAMENANWPIYLYLGSEGRLLTTFSGHSSPISFLAFATDNELVTAGEDGLLKFWDRHAGKSEQQIQAHGSAITQARLSGDRRRLATYCPSEQSLKVWHPRRGELLRDLVVPSPLPAAQNLAFRQDGQMLAYAGADAYRVTQWVLPYEQKLAFPGQSQGHLLPVSGLQFAEDGKALVSVDTSGKTFRWPIPASGPPAVQAAPLDGARLAILGPAGHSAVAIDRGLRLQAAGGAEPVSAPHPLAEFAPSPWAFHPDGSLLAAIGGQEQASLVSLWHAGTGEEQKRLLIAPQRARAVAFSSDGNLLAVGAAAGANGMIHLWQEPDWRKLKAISAPAASLTCLAVRPGNAHFAAGTEKGLLKVWTVQGKLVGQFPQGAAVTSIAYSPDGKRCAAAGADGAVRIWTVNGNSLVLVGAYPLLAAGAIGPTQPMPRPISQLQFSPEGRHLAVGCGSGLVCILRLETAK